MSTVIGIIIGLVGGFLIHSLTMKINFKQRTIDNKIKVYDAIIAHWVQMRNFVFANFAGIPEEQVREQAVIEFDQIYGNSQTYIGEIFLVCDDVKLAEEINKINERVYRTEWNKLQWDEVNNHMEQLKIDALVLVARMREDIRNSTRIELGDITHIFSGFWKS